MFIIFTVLFQPIIIAVLGLCMLKDKGAESAMFVVVGSGLTGLWSSLLFISGNSINAERWSGTLEALVAIPTPFEVIIFGKNLANVLQSLVSMVVGYLIAAYAFGYSLSVQQPGLFFVSVILTVIAFISFGLVIAPIFVMNPGVRAGRTPWNFPFTCCADSCSRSRCCRAGRRPSPSSCRRTGRRWRCTGPRPAARRSTRLLFAWGMMLLFSMIDLLIASRLFK